VGDNLKADAQVAFSGQGFENLRAILAQPSDTNTVEALGKLLLTATPVDGGIQIDSFQWEVMADLLAHISTLEPGSPLAQRSVTVFDQLLARAWAVRDQVAKADYWGRTLDAIVDYGTAQLLTDSFWKVNSQGDVYTTITHSNNLRSATRTDGQFCRTVLEAVGDNSTLSRLKAMRTQPPWSQDAMKLEELDKTISIIELQFKYPELKRISRENRLDVASELQMWKRSSAELFDRLANGSSSNAQVHSVFTAISKRLKNQSTDSKPNK
jgi:hypothetical protein